MDMREGVAVLVPENDRVTVAILSGHLPSTATSAVFPQLVQTSPCHSFMAPPSRRNSPKPNETCTEDINNQADSRPKCSHHKHHNSNNINLCIKDHRTKRRPRHRKQIFKMRTGQIRVASMTQSKVSIHRSSEREHRSRKCTPRCSESKMRPERSRARSKCKLRSGESDSRSSSSKQNGECRLRSDRRNRGVDGRKKSKRSRYSRQGFELRPIKCYNVNYMMNLRQYIDKIKNCCACDPMDCPSLAARLDHHRQEHHSKSADDSRDNIYTQTSLTFADVGKMLLKCLSNKDDKSVSAKEESEDNIGFGYNRDDKYLSNIVRDMNCRRNSNEQYNNTYRESRNGPSRDNRSQYNKSGYDQTKSRNTKSRNTCCEFRSNSRSSYSDEDGKINYQNNIRNNRRKNYDTSERDCEHVNRDTTKMPCYKNYGPRGNMYENNKYGGDGNQNYRNYSHPNAPENMSAYYKNRNDDRRSRILPGNSEYYDNSTVRNASSNSYYENENNGRRRTRNAGTGSGFCCNKYGKENNRYDNAPGNRQRYSRDLEPISEFDRNSNTRRNPFNSYDYKPNSEVPGYRNPYTSQNSAYNNNKSNYQGDDRPDNLKPDLIQQVRKNYADNIRDVVQNWMLTVPFYPDPNPMGSENQKNAVYELIEKIIHLSRIVGNCSYESAVKYEINNCLEKLHIWSPGAKREQEPFKSKLSENLYTKIQDINKLFFRDKKPGEKSDVLMEECRPAQCKSRKENSVKSVINSSYVCNTSCHSIHKTKHYKKACKYCQHEIQTEVLNWLNKNKIIQYKGIPQVNEKDIVGILMGRLVPFLKKPYTTTNKLILKAKIIDIIDSLPICILNAKSQKLKLINVAEDLAKRLLSIQARLDKNNGRCRRCALINNDLCRDSDKSIRTITVDYTAIFQDRIRYCLENLNVDNQENIENEIANVLTKNYDSLKARSYTDVRNMIVKILQRFAPDLAAADVLNKVDCIFENVDDLIQQYKGNYNDCSKIRKDSKTPCLSGIISVYATQKKTLGPIIAFPVTNISRTTDDKLDVLKLIPEERDYMEKVILIIVPWIENSLPAEFNNTISEDSKKNLVYGLAGDIVDQMKLAQIAPSSKISKEKFWRYFIYKWLNRVEAYDDLNKAEPVVKVMVKKLKDVPVPKSDKPQHSKQPTAETTDSVEAVQGKRKKGENNSTNDGGELSDNLSETSERVKVIEKNKTDFQSTYKSDGSGPSDGLSQNPGHVDVSKENGNIRTEDKFSVNLDRYDVNKINKPTNNIMIDLNRAKDIRENQNSRPIDNLTLNLEHVDVSKRNETHRPSDNKNEDKESLDAVKGNGYSKAVGNITETGGNVDLAKQNRKKIEVECQCRPISDDDYLKDDITTSMSKQPQSAYLAEDDNAQNEQAKTISDNLRPNLLKKCHNKEICQKTSNWLKKIVKPCERKTVDDRPLTKDTTPVTISEETEQKRSNELGKPPLLSENSVNLIEELHIGQINECCRSVVASYCQGCSTSKGLSPRTRSEPSGHPWCPRLKTQCSKSICCGKSAYPNETMKEIILKYIEQNYDGNELARGPYTLLLMKQLEKLSPLTKNDAHVKYQPNSHNMSSAEELDKELNYIKDVSDWLHNVPVESSFNTVGNKDRIEFVNNLASTIAKLEKTRLRVPNPSDYDHHLVRHIGDHIDRLPLLPPVTDITSMIGQLMGKIYASRRQPPSVPNQSMNATGIREQDLTYFIKEYIRNNNKDLVSDELRLDALTKRLADEINKIVPENNPASFSKYVVYERLVDTSITDEAVKLFGNELNYAKVITDWLKTMPLVHLTESKRVVMISDLARRVTERDLIKDNYPNDELVDKEFEEYVGSWVSSLPLDRYKKINIPVATEDLINRIDNVYKTFLESEQEEMEINNDIEAPLNEEWNEPKSALVDSIERWCNNLPIKGKNEAQCQEASNGIATKLFLKVGKLNDDPAINNDNFVYNAMLGDEVDILLNNLPHDVNLQGNKETLKADLLEQVSKARNDIKQMSAGLQYKQKLEKTIDSSLPNPVQTNGEDPGFTLYKKHLAEKFILDNFDHTDEAVKQKYEKKIQKEIDKYFQNARNRNAVPLHPDQLNNELYSTLYNLPIPKENTIGDEVAEIKTKVEIDEWYDTLPVQKPAGYTDILEKDQKTEMLARKIREIEEGKDISDGNKDQEVNNQVTKWLTTAPLQLGQQQYIKQFANELIRRLNATMEARKCVTAEENPIKYTQDNPRKCKCTKNKIPRDNCQLTVCGRKKWIVPSLPTQQNQQTAPAKKSSDLIIDAVEAWCNQLPLPNNMPQDQMNNKAIREDIETKIIKKISELNNDPEAFNNDDIYDRMLDNFLDTELSRYNLNENKDARKYQLKETIKSIKPVIKEEKAHHEYKQNLRNTIGGILEEPAEKTVTEEDIINEIKEEIFDNFIEYKYGKDNDECKSFHKRKIQEATAKYLENIEDSNGVNKTVDPMMKGNQIISELSKIIPPSDAAIKEEVQELRMKHEVNDFFNELHFPKDNFPQDRVIRNQMKTILAKKLNDIEKHGHSPATELQLKAEITNCLRELGTEVSPDKIDKFIDRLKANESSRKAPPPKKEEFDRYTVPQGQIPRPSLAQPSPMRGTPPYGQPGPSSYDHSMRVPPVQYSVGPDQFSQLNPPDVQFAGQPSYATVPPSQFQASTAGAPVFQTSGGIIEPWNTTSTLGSIPQPVDRITADIHAPTNPRQFIQPDRHLDMTSFQQMGTVAPPVRKMDVLGQLNYSDFGQGVLLSSTLQRQYERPIPTNQEQFVQGQGQSPRAMAPSFNQEPFVQDQGQYPGAMAPTFNQEQFLQGQGQYSAAIPPTFNQEQFVQDQGQSPRAIAPTFNQEQFVQDQGKYPGAIPPTFDQEQFVQDQGKYPGSMTPTFNQDQFVQGQGQTPRAIAPTFNQKQFVQDQGQYPEAIAPTFNQEQFLQDQGQYSEAMASTFNQEQFVQGQEQYPGPMTTTFQPDITPLSLRQSVGPADPSIQQPTGPDTIWLSLDSSIPPPQSAPPTTGATQIYQGPILSDQTTIPEAQDYLNAIDTCKADCAQQSSMVPGGDVFATLSDQISEAQDCPNAIDTCKADCAQRISMIPGGGAFASLNESFVDYPNFSAGVPFNSTVHGGQMGPLSLSQPGQPLRFSMADQGQNQRPSMAIQGQLPDAAQTGPSSLLDQTGSPMVLGGGSNATMNESPADYSSFGARISHSSTVNEGQMGRPSLGQQGQSLRSSMADQGQYERPSMARLDPRASLIAKRPIPPPSISVANQYSASGFPDQYIQQGQLPQFSLAVQSQFEGPSMVDQSQFVRQSVVDQSHMHRPITSDQSQIIRPNVADQSQYVRPIVADRSQFAQAIMEGQNQFTEMPKAVDQGQVMPGLHSVQLTRGGVNEFSTLGSMPQGPRSISVQQEPSSEPYITIPDSRTYQDQASGSFEPSGRRKSRVSFAGHRIFEIPAPEPQGIDTGVPVSSEHRGKPDNSIETDLRSLANPQTDFAYFDRAQSASVAWQPQGFGMAAPMISSYDRRIEDNVIAPDFGLDRRSMAITQTDYPQPYQIGLNQDRVLDGGRNATRPNFVAEPSLRPLSGIQGFDIGIPSSFPYYTRPDNVTQETGLGPERRLAPMTHTDYSQTGPGDPRMPMQSPYATSALPQSVTQPFPSTVPAPNSPGFPGLSQGLQPASLPKICPAWAEVYQPLGPGLLPQIYAENGRLAGRHLSDIECHCDIVRRRNRNLPCIRNDIHQLPVVQFYDNVNDFIPHCVAPSYYYCS